MKNENFELKMEILIKRLESEGFKASFEYPGYIEVTLGEFTVNIGFADGYLGWDVQFLDYPIFPLSDSNQTIHEDSPIDDIYEIASSVLQRISNRIQCGDKQLAVEACTAALQEIRTISVKCQCAKIRDGLTCPYCIAQKTLDALSLH